MKYTYAYKTSDGVRHEDSMNASSREEVFTVLRGRGIKAIKVVAADGSKANGEIPPPRVPRLASIVVIVVLVALSVAALGGAVWIAARSASAPYRGESRSSAFSPRHQIYGDPVVVGAFERGDFAAHLPRLGDRLLAVFAQPGKLMCAKGADPRRLYLEAVAKPGRDARPARPRSRGTRDPTRCAGFCNCLLTHTGVAPSSATAFDDYAKCELSSAKDLPVRTEDPREVRELKQIVNGMREEMREYLANGNGTPRSFWRRLNERTTQEMQIYERTRRELEKETSEEVWEQKNDALRRLGLRTIPNPNE